MPVDSKSHCRVLPSQSINQSAGLFVWKLRSWIETCIQPEL